MSKYGEPWRFGADRVITIEDASGRKLAGMHDYPHVVDKCFDLGELRRIVSCVNAMANVEHPTELIAEVRELLSDLREFASDHSRCEHTKDGRICTGCGTSDHETHLPECATKQLLDRANAMLARLAPAGNRGRIEEPR